MPLGVARFDKWQDELRDAFIQVGAYDHGTVMQDSYRQVILNDG